MCGAMRVQMRRSKILKAHDAREMGRYWSGLAGSPCLNTGTTVLIFHAAGTVFQCRTKLKNWSSMPRHHGDLA